MNIFVKITYKLGNLFDHTDEKVARIYELPIKKIDKANKRMIEVNKLLHHKTVTFKIARVTGAI